jgi:serine/threonine-protein kinase
MNASADRDLLFGLIALQVGLIDQAHLVAAFQAWARDKAGPLAEHLGDRGGLDAEGRAAVEAMVALHLRKHEGDVERSLAAMPVGRSTRERLAGLGDTEIDATLSHLGPVSIEPDTDTTFSVGSSTSDGQRFRVLRPHARGGLGAVFVALDGEFNREVALKQILDAHADDPTSRQRFLVEAEITGGLEHPGIVPVYGLGAYQDGRPYYAMRFIQGDSLKDAVAGFHADPGLRSDPARRSLAFRRLLRRFTDVCNAIEYAHARGVLHRDIKPGNIIVGKYGETLVVDWGLAKALGHADPEAGERTLMPSLSSGSADTLPGSAIGTPAYMSPEQARGDLDALGPRSDVYSLGGTLYCLLTGKPPFEGDDPGAILQRVQTGDHPRPRQLDPSIDPALEAVCLTAMALKPDDRYASCRALADDLERWLADEPVTAYAEPFSRRARRWMKRNRLLVASASAALVMAAIGLGVISAVQTRARNDLAAKNVALVAQRRRAEANEAQAIDAVKRFRDAVVENPELKNDPGLDELRKALLKEPLVFFRSLRNRLQADRDTRPEALARLGSASFSLGGLADEIGDKQDALTAYLESREIFQRLADAHPTVTEYQNNLARIHNNSGNLLRATGKPEEALAAYEQARAMFQKLADANPTVTEYQNSLANIHNSIGILLNETGKPTEALAAYEQALSIQQKLADANPTVTRYQSDLGISHNNIGALLNETGKPTEAMAAYEQALSIQQKLADANPTVARYQISMASIHFNIGYLLRATGKPTEALAAYEQSLSIQQKLADANPTVTRYQSDLAFSHNNIGVLLKATGKPTEALAAYERALEIQRSLAREHPESPRYASSLGGALSNIALIDLDARQFDVARDRFREAIIWQKKALAANSRDPTYRQFMTNHLIGLVRAARGLNDPDLAAKAQRELVELKATDPRFAEMDARLKNVLGGESPKDNAERLTLAQRASDVGRYVAAARLWADALEADPKLAADRRAQHCYNAACAASLAASGVGKGEPAPDDAAKARLRRQALDWLEAELGVWAKYIASGTPQQRAAIVRTLRHWQDDADLASIRDAKALDALPEAERAAWRELWARVAALASQAGSTPDSAMPDGPEAFAR